MLSSVYIFHHTNSLSELKEDNVRTVETAEKKAKDIVELKERYDALQFFRNILFENTRKYRGCSFAGNRLLKTVRSGT